MLSAIFSMILIAFSGILSLFIEFQDRSGIPVISIFVGFMIFNILFMFIKTLAKGKSSD
jgi:cytochrome b subunit of formate dehydrogenase